MKRIAFYTLGCKVNQADTASMEAIFRSHGYTVVGFNCEADIYVINTCVVTNTGQRKSRQMINRAVRRNPTAFVVVTGCYPQTAAEEVKTIPGVDLIIGNQDRADIVRLVEEAAAFQSVDTIDSVRKLSANTEFEELSAGDVSDKTRAFLKIQEGCNQFCTYCIIPFARGPLRSRSLTSIREEVKKLVASGYKEIVLIGIALSMDAFAVCVASSMVYTNMTWLRKLSMPIMFGLFQGIMPILGFFLGSLFASFIEKWSGPISLLILGIIGINMIREGLAKDEETEPKKLTLWILLVQAVATSIDAFAVGVSFAANSANIWQSAPIIAVTTFVLSLIALFVGTKAGEKLGDKAEILGGIILIIIGIKSLF